MFESLKACLKWFHILKSNSWIQRNTKLFQVKLNKFKGTQNNAKKTQNSYKVMLDNLH